MVTFPNQFLNNINKANPSDSIHLLDKMVDRIARGEYILVVGNEMLLNPKVTNGVSDVSKYFVAATCQVMGIENSNYDSFNKLDCKLKWIREAYLKTLQVYQDSVAPMLRDKDSEDYNNFFTLYDPSLLELIRGKWFRIVLTTTTDPLLEIIMRETWGDELQIKTIFGNTAEDKDFTEADTDGREYYPYPPTLYYVFGKADYLNPEKVFVLTDNDIIDCISRWLGDDQPKRFFNFIKAKRLLSVGCRLDDWCFRFFWHALRQDTDKSHGDIVLSLNENHESDRNLKNYFKEQKIHLEEDVESFIKKMIERLSDNRLRDNILSNNKSNGVFISYANEDKAIALSIYRHLVDAGINVWMDISLNGGEDFDKEIPDAIKKCKIFLPILTNQTKKDLENGKTKRYYQKEWNIAEGENVPWKTLPVQAFGYDARADYHKKTTRNIISSSVFDWKNRPISELINKIESILREKNNKSL